MAKQRYDSGTCLELTRKEQHVELVADSLHAELSDELFIALKGLSIAQLRELREHICARIVNQ